MRTLLLPLLLVLPLMLVKAAEPEIHCPGQNSAEIRFCAPQRWEESNQALKAQLKAGSLKTWVNAIQEVCAAAYAQYRQGTIYPQMVVECDDRLNHVLLEELRF